MNKRILGVGVSIIFFTTVAYAQQVILGANNYVEYQVGTLPLVISVSHGGNLEPSSIPIRMCNNPVYATDAFTLETALEIKNSLFAKTGYYPHLIISHLKRNRLDPNRSLSEGACGNSEAEAAWNEFHSFITVARNSANQQYNSKTFFVDLHGHGNPIQRIELGYLLYDNELDLADNLLNTNQYINYSSIKNLANSNLNNYTHAQLLRGPKSFGTLLANHNFPSVPSQNIPSPGTTTNYFSGGYITANHTCYSSGIDINGLQVELNYTGVRDSPSNRRNFASVFSEVIIEYMNIHFNMTWNYGITVSADQISLQALPEFYPNPVKRGEFIYFDYVADNTCTYYIYNLLGQHVKMGRLSKWENTIDTKDLNSGIYLIQTPATQSNVMRVKKMTVQ